METERNVIAAPEPSLVNLKPDRIQYWYSKGATLSPAVATILKKQNIKLSRKTS